MKRKRRSETAWPKNVVLKWSQLWRGGAGRAATRPDLSLDFRIFLLAVSRQGKNGHTPFDPDELADLLERVNKTTGEVTRFSDRHLERKIKVLVDAGVLGEGSSVRCLVMPLDLVSTKERSRVLCPEHRHLYAWQGGGWVGLDDHTGEVYAVDGAAA